MGTLEGDQMLKILVELLDGHAALWPIVASIKATYARAAVILGERIDLHSSAFLTTPGLRFPSTSTCPMDGPLEKSLLNVEDQTDMGWQNLSLMFDPAYFLSMTHEDL
jgi:hypothetical protein